MMSAIASHKCMQTRGEKRVGVTDRVASTCAHEIAAGEDVGCEVSNDVLDFIEDASDEKQDCRTQVKLEDLEGQIKEVQEIEQLSWNPSSLAGRTFRSFGLLQQCVRRFEGMVKRGLKGRRRKHQWCGWLIHCSW